MTPNQKARNRAILYILLGLVVFLYALSFIRVERQSWNRNVKMSLTHQEKH